MKKKAALLTVFLVVLIDLMGFGIVLPLLPFYASKFHASAVEIGLLYSIYSLAQLIVSPLWGGLSDRVGRRPIMLMSTLGSFLAYVLFGLSNSFAVLFVSRLIAGVMGGNISAAQAYVADVTTHEDRAKGMGLIGAAFGIGFVMGPALATLLIHPGFHSFIEHTGFSGLSRFIAENKYAVPGFVAAFMSFMSFLLVLSKLPETVQNLKSGDSERISRQSIFTAGFWRSALGQDAKRVSVFPLLMISIFLLSLGHSSLYSAFPLFCKTRLGLSAEKVGMQFVYMGLIAVLIQGGLIRQLVKYFSEEMLFTVGSFLMVAGLGLIPFAVSERTLMAYLSLMAVGASLNGPTLNSLISKASDPSKVGATMGASQGLSALGRTIGPTWGGFLFGVSFRLPFLATAAVLLSTVFVGSRLVSQKLAK